MKSVRKPERNSTVTREHLVISRLAQTDALARHLIENGIITRQKLLLKIPRSGATYQRVLKQSAIRGNG
jgi:hypothetical protein